MNKLLVISFWIFVSGNVLKAQIPTIDEVKERFSRVNVLPFVGVWSATMEGKDYILTLSAYEQPVRKFLFRGIRGSLEIRDGRETVKHYPEDENNPFLAGWISDDSQLLNLTMMDSKEKVHDYAEFKFDTTQTVARWNMDLKKENIGYARSTLPRDMVFTRVK